MYCSNCGHEVKDGSMFCPYCGVSLNKNGISQKEKDTKFNYKLEKKRQPTKALVVEGIGFVFFIYLLLLNSTADRNWDNSVWLEDNGVWVFLIGMIFVSISYFMFRRFRKKQPLVGLGYIGYIISCIAIVLIAVMLIFGIVDAVLLLILGIV